MAPRVWGLPMKGRRQSQWWEEGPVGFVHREHPFFSLHLKKPICQLGACHGDRLQAPGFPSPPPPPSFL